MSTRPAKGEWAVVYRSSLSPLPLVQSSIWLHPLGSFTDSAEGMDYCSFQSNTTMAADPTTKRNYLLQDVLLLQPSKVTWLCAVQDEATPLHYFEVDLLDLNAQSLEGCLVSFSVYGGLMGIDIIDPLDGYHVFQGAHNLPGKLLQPMMSTYLAACGWGDGSGATFQNLNGKIVHQSDPGTVNDLAVAMWNYETPPVPMDSTLEGSNTYQPFPQVLEPNQITTYAQVGSWF